MDYIVPHAQLILFYSLLVSSSLRTTLLIAYCFITTVVHIYKNL